MNDKRKQTPDVLAEILGGGQPVQPEELDAPIPQPRPKPARQTNTPQPKPAAPRHPAPPTEGWEYQVVSFQDYKGWRARFVNGKELNDWVASPLLHEYLQQASQQGWELTAASAGEPLYGSTDKHQLYFRRKARKS